MELKPVFEYGKAVCTVCETPLGEPNIYWIGNKPYCAEHYEKESFSEKWDKKVLESQRTLFKKLTIPAE